MTTTILLSLLATHFIGDQLIQPSAMRENKHRNSTTMFWHVMTWSLVMLPLSFLMALTSGNWGTWFGWWFTITVLHFLIEWPISRQVTMVWYSRYIHKAFFWMHLEHLLISVMLVATFIYFSTL